ncbi:MAG: hypothetical protein NZ960_08575, partial [Candidatus Kapabacteria bacterium]|nr:hypothetical protein [Candidatus Kapabacteria bacterium]
MTAGGEVGIGTATPARRLHVVGAVGQAAARFVAVGGATVAIEAQGHIVPTGIGYDLGSAGQPWANVHGGDFIGDNAVLNGTLGVGQSASVRQTLTVGDGSGPLGFINVLANRGGAAIQISNAHAAGWAIDAGGHILPTVPNTYDLGSATQRWANVHGVNGNFGTLTLSGLTPGSVLFAGPGGQIREDNANFYWDDASNRLGLGTSTPTATLDVVGTALVRGDLQVDGSTTLGDAATDGVVFVGRVNSDIVPASNNAYDLGLAGQRWRTGYFGTSVVVGSTVTITTSDIQYSGAGQIGTAAGDLSVYTAGAERLRVTAGGEVGIGTATPARRLHVV